MRVIIEDTVFSSPRTDTLDLLALLHFGYEGRHRVQTDPLSSPTVDSWLGQMPETLRDECLLALESGLELEARAPSRTTVRVGDVPEPRWNRTEPLLPLKSALQVTTRPFSVLLEDNLSDRHFVLAVATEERRKALGKMVKEAWLEFTHAGGITNMLRRVKQLSSPEEALRTWVLFDSDAMRAGHPSQQSAEVADACQKFSLPCHQLSRRAIENYVPVPALRKWHRTRQQKQRVRALGRLASEQRHYYNMKRGFAGDRSREAEAGNLYDGLDANIRNVLAHGIDEHIAELFSEAEYPMEAWWFVQDGQSSEAAAMLDTLLSLV